MKKAILLSLIVLICFNAFSQPIVNRSGASNTVQDARWMGQYNAFMPRYSDTISANLQKGIDSCGAMIFTYDIMAMWYRSCYNGGKKWIQLLPSGSGLGSGGWLLNYNTLLPQAYGNIGFGLVQNRGINFATNNTVRFSLDSTGILPYASTVIPLGFDSVSKKLARASGGTVSLNLQQVTDVGNTTTNDIIFSSPYPSRNSLTWTSNGGTDYGQLIYGGNTGNYTWTLPNKTGTVALLSDITDNSWGLSGNGGTASGTNFIGTTDNVGLMFKVNGNQAGFLDVNNSNTSFGDGSLALNTSGNLNVAIGYNSQSSITTGVNNVSVGASSLQSANSSYNTAIGEGSLSVVSGNMNIGLGRYSGRYLTTESNRLIINSINRTNKGNDTTQSIIYGAQDATAANQRLYFNSQVYLPYVNSGVGTKALRINPGTGIITYADTTTSSGGTVTSVASGNGMNFSTITGTGTVTMGTPSSVTLSSTNSTTTNSHTHAFAPGGTTAQYIRGDGTLATTPTGTVSTATLPLSISGSNISMTKASATDSGWVSTGTQTFAGAKTFSGLITSSANGAVSTPAISITGTPSTAGTTTTDHPLMYFNGGTAPTTWSDNGTYLGVNAVSGFTGNFVDFHVNGGASMASVDYQGVARFATAAYAPELRITGGASGSLYFNDGSGLYSRIYGSSFGDGVIKLTNNSNNGFDRLCFGGTTSSFPSIARNGTGIDIKLADNSAYTNLGVRNLTLNIAGSKITVPTGTNASAGTGTFSSGTATISTTAVTASSLIFIQHTSCTACGTPYIGTVTAATSFVVNSTNVLDGSTFNWWLIN